MSDGHIGVALLVTALLIFINGALASAELAMIGLNEARLQTKADSGDKRAKLLLYMKQNPTNFLSTVQIGITLAGLLSGAFAADTLARPLVLWAAERGLDGMKLSIFSAAAVFLITLVMTFFMLVFGELVPKRIAMAKPEGTARRVISPIHALSKLAKPLVYLLTVSTNAVLKLCGIDPKQEESVTEEDVLLMMRAGHRQGQIEAVEMEVVKNLFAFTDLRVEDAMTHRTNLKTLPLDGTIAQVTALMRETGLNKFPVVDGTADHIAGILYAKDIVSRYSFSDSAQPLPSIRDLMRQPLFVPEEKMLVELFADLKLSGERIAVVVDGYGGTSGIITMMDILEEIVGDIDTISPGIVETADGSFLVDGLAEMSQVAALLDLESHNGGTMSGFLIGLLGFVPQRNERPSVSYGGYRFQVEGMSGGRIDSALVQREACQPTG